MSGKEPVLLGLDDDPDIGELPRAIGANAGFSVATSTVPAAFKESLRRLRPDVVVLDLQMPGMDGVQMLRWLADEAVEAGVLLVSGMDERTIGSAEQFGTSRGLRVLGTLQKPAGLKRSVQSELERHPQRLRRAEVAAVSLETFGTALGPARWLPSS